MMPSPTNHSKRINHLDQRGSQQQSESIQEKKKKKRGWGREEKTKNKKKKQNFPNQYKSHLHVTKSH